MKDEKEKKIILLSPVKVTALLLLVLLGSSLFLDEASGGSFELLSLESSSKGSCS
jgi:hypothetical protein